MRTVLFVCSGNTCRSPMAEAIARHHLDQGVFGPDEGDVFVASAGVFAGDGTPYARETRDAVAEMGIDFDGSSKCLSEDMVRKADVIFCMTRSHHQQVTSLIGHDPEQVQKIVLLDPAGDVDDPIGRGVAAYQALAAHMNSLIPQRLKEMLGHEDRARV